MPETEKSEKYAYSVTEVELIGEILRCFSGNMERGERLGLLGKLTK